MLEASLLQARAKDFVLLFLLQLLILKRVKGLTKKGDYLGRENENEDGAVLFFEIYLKRKIPSFRVNFSSGL
jgi:hypothetical protein